MENSVLIQRFNFKLLEHLTESFIFLYNLIAIFYYLNSQ